MKAWFHSLWQHIKQHLVTILIGAIILVAATALIIIGYRFNWTGFNGNNKSGKTLWDWLQLIIIPLALAIIAILFNRAERKNEREIATQRYQHDQEMAAEKQREELLQTYLDRMSDLLLEKNLRTSKPDDEVRNTARARTLTVLPQLDAKRKTNLTQFLHESHLIGVIDLSGADLSGVNLNGVNLSGISLNHANLSKAHLIGVNLRCTDLRHANLVGASLMGANLSDTDLSGTDLRDADLFAVRLYSADLSGAELMGTNLRYAKLTGARLIGTKLMGADLLYADLSNTVLSYADLSEANLSDTDLRNADLSEANLSGAVLARALVTPEQLDQAKSPKGAIVPDRFIHP